ncbi:helix-turn-helix transcriptional regulator [Bacillus cereus]|uniref:helix-turn-helix transcriptional regulator n=1 Tax=Bacillus cereus TaxID=1396 RepID=UPI003D957DA1
MKITEYTLIEREGHNGHKFYSIQLADSTYYKTYEEDAIKVTNEIEYASRIAKEQFAFEHIGFLQNFYDKNGERRQENIGMVIPPIVGLSEAAELLGWSKQYVSEYIRRGKFPTPLKTLASGPIWTYKQIEDYQNSRK